MTKPTSHGIFWLARYAYNAVAGHLKEGEKLIVHLNFGGNYPGVDVWIHAIDAGTVREYATSLATQKDVDRFVQTLKGKVAA